MEPNELIQEWMEEKKVHNFEGSRGLEGLCQFVRALGYKDAMHRMQFRDGCIGDLIEFFEDNPGAIEAVVNWVGEQNTIQEWKENLESELPARKVKDEYEDGVCPDCQTEIPDDAVEGENCSNCEHVFCFERAED